MNKKILKKVLIIIILFVVLFVCYKITTTYAVFYSEGNGQVVQKNSNWKILVNNTNISSGILTKFEVNEFETSQNEHVEDGKIAPSITGFFFITIDPTNTDVSIRYDINLDKTALEGKTIEIITIEEIETKANLTLTAENTYTGVIPLIKIKEGTTNKIKIAITWENNEENNESDTALGSSVNAKMNIPITVSIKQYLGEELEEYEAST